MTVEPTEPDVRASRRPPQGLMLLGAVLWLMVGGLVDALRGPTWVTDADLTVGV